MPFLPGYASVTPGVLYIVATPIGNPRDITIRALDVLAEVDLIAAEDTRKTGLLLQARGIKKPLISCFAHNEQARSAEIIESLKEGKAVALVSDAGTPGISDPGARLVRRALEEGLDISVVPGPSAVVAALCASGMDMEPFAFGGFFPRKGNEKKAWIAKFSDFPGSLVFFESPRRVRGTMSLLSEDWGDRKCCLAREITKRYEEFIRGSVADIAARLEASDPVKGEIVVVVEGNPKRSGVDEIPRGVSGELMDELIEILLESGMRKKEASQKLARLSGLPAKECYAMMIKKPRMIKKL